MTLFSHPAAVAALVTAPVILFVAADLLARARPRSWLVPAAYGMGLGAALAATVVLAFAAVASRSLSDTAAAAAWIAALWMLGRLVLFQNRRFARRRAAAVTCLLPWLAMLAPIGTPSDDGKRALLAGHWRVPKGGAPLWMTDPEQPDGSIVLGRVDRVWVDRERLMAAGVIRASADVAGLLPEISVMPNHSAVGAFDRGGELSLFAAGTVTSVHMGCRPAFTGVWLRIGNHREAAR